MLESEAQIGAPVVHDGRPYILRGFSRMSLDGEQFVHLQDTESGQWVNVPLTAVEFDREPA